MARSNRSTGEEPKRRSRFFWICLLVLLMIVVWMVLKPLIDSDTARTWIAIVAGVIFVGVYREKIWGEDWREQFSAQRGKPQDKRRPRR